MKRSATFRRALSFVFIVLFFCANSIAQQIVLEDDFEDEDLNLNPQWMGDTGDFITVDESGNQLLRLDASEAGTSVLTTASSTVQGTWELFYRFDESPSGSNRTRIFLIADTEDLDGNVNGYAISIGESGGDPFRLQRYDNGSETDILSSTTEVTAGQGYQIRVTRTSAGEWNLYIGEGIGSVPLLEGNTVNDATHSTSSYFGFLLDYTSTRVDQFFFDDVLIENSEPFDVISTEVTSATEIDVTFNYQIDDGTIQPLDFSVESGIGNPTSVSPEDDFTVRLSYDSVLPDGNHTVTVNDVDNIYGATIPAGTEADFSVSNPFDVVSVDVVTASRISVEFTEQPDETSWSMSDFEITDDGSSTATINPTSIDYDDTSEPNTIYLNLGSSLSIGDYDISIQNVTSTDGWPIAGDTEFNFTVSNPFFVANFEYLSRTEFDITFSQDVDGSTLNATDFEITGFGSPENAQLEESNRVRISYNSAIGVGDRELVINSLSSITGWEIEANTTVEFTLFDGFESGDLVISEFYYRVPINWRTTEYDRPQYVEIYNRTDKLLNLRNFTINGENISMDEDLPIESEEYLVIMRGVPVFEDQFGDRNFVEADEFPELVLTTSDYLILETNEGEEVESLTYDASEWGGNEVSLERFSFDVPASFRDNWAESEDVLTGSPGLPNTITEPTNPPEEVEASFPAPATLQVTFSRTLSDESVDNLVNFSLNNGEVINNAEFTSNPRTLEFDLDDVLEDQFEYTFSYQNVEDIFGNEVSGTQEFNFIFENPFRILSAETENDNNLLVQFTLPLQVSTVDLSDFELGDGTAPTSLEFPNSETVRLTFSDSFSNGSYEIVVNDLESLNNGWQIEENSTAEFFRFDDYQEGDIVITEFMYNPPSGYPQYVELYNQSGRFLTIKDFELLRAEGSTSLGGVITEFDQPIEPGEYLVITEDSELLENVFGSGPWFEMEEFPGFTQTVSDQIRLLDPDGVQVETIEYDPSTWGGSEIALERRSIDAPANDLNNWGESLGEDLGTPGEDNTAIPDDGPTLVSAAFVDAETVLVNFTGSLDIDTISSGNFDINRGLSVDDVTFINSTQAELSLDEEMSSGETYTVTVTDIPDIFGNELEEAQATFTYYFVETSEPGDIVINEFMYDEPDGYTEYVELYNTSEKVFNLSGWQQANDTGTRRVLTDEQIYFTPGSYIVVLPNEELLSIFPAIDFVNAGSSLPALKNSGDEIVITNAAGVTLDSLRYSSGWGGGEVSLERIDTDAVSSDINNWAESLDVLNGTPGRENTVDANTDGPELLAADFIDEESVRIRFSGALDRSSISENNFEISNGITIQNITFTNNMEAVLFLDQSMSSGQTYTVTVHNIPDIFGNELEQAQTSFTYFHIETAEPGDIVINEFMYDEPDGYTEYIELYNKSGKVFNLVGWQQANDTGTRRSLTEETIYFHPGSYMVIIPNEDLLDTFSDIPYVNAGSNFSTLKNSGDEIVITNAEGATLDSLRYSSEWGGDEVALERIDRNAISSDINNWDESLAVLKGTPGEENSVDIDTDGPELLSADFINGESIQVVFSGALNRSEISRNNFDLSGGISINEVTFTNSTEAVLFLDESLNSGQTYAVTVTDIPDIFGNELDEASVSFIYYLVETADPGDVVINEIMYDEPENYTEYIELYNVSDKAIDLAGWQQANDTATRRILTEEQKILPPDSYIAILPNFNLLNIFPDIPHLNAGTGLPALKNGGDNIVVANAEGVIIDSLRYSPEWGGEGVSLERRRANRSSLYPENWANSPSEQFGTPGMPNKVERDFFFSVTDVRALSPTLVRVVFNAPVRNHEIEAVNFSVGVTNPNSISKETDQIVLLEFSDPMVSGAQTLVINDNFSSAGGFSIGDNTEFKFTVFDTFTDGDIVINEFMYRPPSGYVRYVELLNTSSKLLNLRNWRLQRRDVSGDSERIISEEDLALTPGELIVLSEDSTTLKEIFGERNFFELSSFPSLTVTVADQIRLFTNEGVIADSLQYEPSDWGGNEVALERLSANVESTIRENWVESPNELLGTPGLPNEAESDSSPPEIVRAAQYQDQGFVLTFNERLNSNQATDNSNYSIIPNLPISMIALDRNEVILFVGDELTNDQEYEITISGISDIFGIEIEQTTITVRYLEFGEIAPGQVVINEIMYEPSNGTDAEFIEIFNRSDENYDLTGWLLSDEMNVAEIPTGIFIRENDYMVFTDSQSFATESNKFVFIPDFKSLNNSGDAITLKSAAEITIDSLFYQAGWGIDSPGISLERKDPEGLSTDPGNWASSISERGSTPAQKNSVFEIDETPPEILFANLTHPDSIVVEFNEYVQITNDEEDQLVKGGGLKNQTQANARFLLNGTPTDLLYYDDDSGDRVIIDGTVVTQGEEITLSVENLGDYRGNIATQVQHPIAQPISEGDIIFNEIMFDPISDEHDGLPDQSQYVEIHNRRSYAISLEGFVLHDEPDEDGEISVIEPIQSNHQWLPANGYALIYPEPDDVPFSNSRAAEFFDLSGNMEEFAIQTDRTTLSLSNTGRQIYLADSTMQTIDMVDYAPEWHNPNIVDTKGIALERINPNFETNDEANWGSNATPLGGSPGSENSIYQGSEQTISGNDIAFGPNPFSPDDDGYEDNLLINYSFDEPDYLIKVRIYDRYGRLVRKLAEAKRAGFEGALVWDGKTDDGLRNRVGIYIILLEAYNSANGKNLSFKETVVIARQF